MSDLEAEAVSTIAEGSATDAAYVAGQDAWKMLIREFVEKDVGDEVALYHSKGATFVDVLHHADDSDYSDTSAGSMALFVF